MKLCNYTQDFHFVTFSHWILPLKITAIHSTSKRGQIKCVCGSWNIKNYVLKNGEQICFCRSNIELLSHYNAEVECTALVENVSQHTHKKM